VISQLVRCIHATQFFLVRGDTLRPVEYLTWFGFTHKMTILTSLKNIFEHIISEKNGERNSISRLQNANPPNKGAHVYPIDRNVHWKCRTFIFSWLCFGMRAGPKNRTTTGRVTNQKLKHRKYM
jgi:hypothetical protein